jgi:hypothetical protein
MRARTPPGQASSRANPGLDRPSVQSRLSMFSLFVLLVLPVLPLHALQLHHRILHPESPPDSPFFKRASIRPDDSGNPAIESVPTLQTDFEAFTRFETQHVTDALLYQLALDLQSDTPWLISSVKAVSLSFPPLYTLVPPHLSSPQCHLVHSANEHLVLHVPHPGGSPFALEYFLDTAPSDGNCPPGWASSPILALPRNLTITVSIPNRPPLFVVTLLMSDQLSLVLLL